MRAPDLLRRAARDIEDALKQLDTSPAGKCDSCGRAKWTNVEHAHVAENIGPVPERLRRAASKVEKTARR